MKSSTFTLLEVPIAEIATYDHLELYQFWQASADHLQTAKKVQKWLETAVAYKYQEYFNVKRIRTQKEFGIIHLEYGDVKISHDVHKKVEWDQGTLEQIIDDIKDSGFNYKDYVDVNYKIFEHKFTSWPSSVKQIFQPARSVKFAKPIYSLSLIEQGGFEA